MTEPLLDIRQLEVVYHDVATAVQGVSIEIAPGSIVAMIGTNGAGKTTTLRAVSGFLPAEDVAVTDGTISFGGQSLRGMLPHQISRLGAVLVPEREKLFQTLTVGENMDFSLTRSRRSIRDTVYDYFPRLAERRKQIAGYLSGGEKQMLAIGMALVCEPKLLTGRRAVARSRADRDERDYDDLAGDQPRHRAGNADRRAERRSRAPRCLLRLRAGKRPRRVQGRS